MTLQLSDQQRKLVEEHVAMAKRIATGVWRSNGGDLQDLISLAFMGLVESASRYDESKGPFENFAKRRIRGSIMDAARSADHVPRSVRSRHKAGDLSVAAQVEKKPVFIDDAIAATLKQEGSIEAFAADHIVAMTVARAVAALPPEHRAVMALHYFAGVELKDIAQYFGVPSSRVGKMHIVGVLAVYDEVRKLV